MAGQRPEPCWDVDQAAYLGLCAARRHVHATANTDVTDRVDPSDRDLFAKRQNAHVAVKATASRRFPLRALPPSAGMVHGECGRSASIGRPSEHEIAPASAVERLLCADDLVQLIATASVKQARFLDPEFRLVCRAFRAAWDTDLTARRRIGTKHIDHNKAIVSRLRAKLVAVDVTSTVCHHPRRLDRLPCSVLRSGVALLSSCMGERDARELNRTVVGPRSEAGEDVLHPMIALRHSG